MRRRHFLQQAGTVSIAAPLLACDSESLITALAAPTEATEPHPPRLTDTVFQHGVASGDPTMDGVVLWTRITQTGMDSVPVRWVLARDPALTEVLLQGEEQASPDQDFTCKIDLLGRLAPATTYYYGFEAFGERSPTGRTRTLPGFGAQQLRIAATTCSNLPTRDEGDATFATYHLLAEREDVDLVLHLGDYIYEFGSDKFEPPFECRRLEEYRLRYAQYRRDPGLQRAHQQFPWVVMWDDHEVANEPWGTGAEFHREDEHGPWQRRKEEATRAFWEWLPLRQPRAEPEKGWRRLVAGDLAEILVLDARLQRSRWISEERDQPFVTIGLTEIDDPDRTKLGAEQEAWLEQQLDESASRWRVLTTGVPMIPWKVPGTPQLPSEVLREFGIRQLPLPVTQGGNALTLDKWDGYPEARRRLIRSLQARGIDNNLVLSGDLHFVLSGDIPLDPFDPLVYDPITHRGSTLVEMVAPAVNSGSFEQALEGTVDEPLRGLLLTALEQGSTLVNPHHVYTNFVDHGILMIDIRPERIQGDYYFLTGDRHRLDGNQLAFAMALESYAAGAGPLGPLSPPNALSRAVRQEPSQSLRPADPPAPSRS
jgi:alkaline phosphatase D